MTKQTSVEVAKRQSRGWSDAMDSDSIAHRLAKLQELHDCWRFFQGGTKRLPAENSADENLSQRRKEAKSTSSQGGHYCLAVQETHKTDLQRDASANGLD